MLAGLTATPGVQVKAASIGESPCAMECRVERCIDWPQRTLVIGQVLHMRVQDRCLDAAGRYVDPAAYQPIARLHADNYIVADRQFELKVPALSTQHPEETHGL